MLAPVFLALVLTAIQISFALHKGNTVQWAINKAARSALVDPTLDEAGIQALVDSRLKSIDKTAKVDIAYTLDTSGTVNIANISGVYYHTVEVPFFPTFKAKFDIDVSVPRP